MIDLNELVTFTTGGGGTPFTFMLKLNDSSGYYYIAVIDPLVMFLINIPIIKNTHGNLWILMKHPMKGKRSWASIEESQV